MHAKGTQLKSHLAIYHNTVYVASTKCSRAKTFAVFA